MTFNKDEKEKYFKDYMLVIPTQPLTWPTGERMVYIGHKKAFVKYLEDAGRIDEVEAMSGPERDKEYLKWLEEKPTAPII